MRKELRIQGSGSREAGAVGREKEHSDVGGER